MTAYSPTSACGHGCLPRPDAVSRVGWPRQVVRLAGLVAVLLAGVGVAVLVPVLTASGRARATRMWFRCVLRACGVWLVVRGVSGLSARAAATGPASASPPASASANGTLVAANHVSWLDIPATLAVEPMRVLAKTDVRDWPVIGLLAARGGALFIDRRRLRGLPGTVTDIAAALRRGQSVLVFPEGTTWCGRTPGRFYPATFQAAVDAGAAVRPVALRYRLAHGSATTVAAFVGDDTLVASVRRVIATRGLLVEVEPMPQVDPAGPRSGAIHAGRRMLSAATAAAIKGGGVRVAQPHLVS